ncbi:hypothetical protein ACA30_20930 [Virgibacillus soli]|uniref:CotD family spore coat protein n=1 Tax=Lederbergia galactosidilytica TaxID=217031 RepID=UPI0007161108|nr:CotD family spore coat protein [Lederbergia galactosidilytica]KRG12102.1 hypothetical protein ACA30_20930 [Virgibacillus soli]MBP1913577.1 spore coat protein D [Lederbergia galactosidilytica]
MSQNHNKKGHHNDVETVFYPTKNVVNTTTNRKTIRRVHPTHVKNINKNITRVENYYPVTESEKDINIVENYNCGNDLENPRCRPINDNDDC